MSDDSRSIPPRRARRSDPGQGPGINIDLGFGDLFKGLGNLLELLGTMSEEGKTEISRSGNIEGPGRVRGVYGLSIKTGLGGKPTVEPFGNIKATDRGPQVSPVREPLVDVFDEGDHIVVVVELPGIAEKDIHIEAKDDILSLTAGARERKYAKEILLPAHVDPASLRHTYQNAVLEIHLNKLPE